MLTALPFRTGLVATEVGGKFMQIRFVVKDTIGGAVSEMAALDENGKVVGYWAYGSWDPSLPYPENLTTGDQSARCREGSDE